VLCRLPRAGLGAAAAAHAAIYVQRDAASGAVLYSNVPASAGKARGHVAVFSPSVPADASQFPRITRAEQQQRDLGRQAILNDELAQERQRLQQAQAAGADAQAQQRHRSNIEALQRELAALH
jgi:hypothetical protein